MLRALNWLFFQSVKKITKDIYREVKDKPRGGKATSSAAAAPERSDTSIKAERASKRQSRLASLKHLLKIEVINKHSLKLLKSPAYQAYIAEKIMFRMGSTTTENVAANFSNYFFYSQFSKRFIANVYWGSDRR